MCIAEGMTVCCSHCMALLLGTPDVSSLAHAGVPAHQQVQQQPRRTLCQAQSGSNDSLEPGPDAQSMPSTASTSGSAPEAQDLSSSGPWTPEKLERLGQRFYDGDAEGMGALWLSEFEDDPEFLFDYVEDAYNEGFSDVISPITLLAVRTRCLEMCMHACSSPATR